MIVPPIRELLEVNAAIPIGIQGLQARRDFLVRDHRPQSEEQLLELLRINRAIPVPVKVLKGL